MPIDFKRARYFPEVFLDAALANPVALTEIPLIRYERFAPLRLSLLGVSTLRVPDVQLRVTKDNQPQFYDLNASALRNLDHTVETFLPTQDVLELRAYSDSPYANWQYRYRLQISKPDQDVKPGGDLLHEVVVSRRFVALAPGANPDIGSRITVPPGQKMILTEIACERSPDQTTFIHVDRDTDNSIMSVNTFAMPDIDYFEKVRVVATDYMQLRLVNAAALAQFRVRYRYEVRTLTDEERQRWMR